MFKLFRNILVLIFLVQSAWAQQARVKIQLDTSTIRIGERVSIRLNVRSSKQNKDLRLSWPELKDTIIKGLEIVQYSKTDTTKASSPNDSLEQYRTVVVTSFDTGYYAIPPFKIIVNGDSSKPLLTDAMLLHVQKMPVDTTQAIKDIKQPLEAPFDWNELIPTLKWIGLVLLVIVITIIITLYVIRKKPAAPVVVKNIRPAHEKALEELEKLRLEKLWQEGKTKEYHSRLTDILRIYIENRFTINALEQTTDEILASFRSVPISIDNKNRLNQIFHLADLIKFAKQSALPDENEMSMTNAVLFVHETAARPEPEKEQGT